MKLAVHFTTPLLLWGIQNTLALQRPLPKTTVSSTIKPSATEVASSTLADSTPDNLPQMQDEDPGLQSLLKNQRKLKNPRPLWTALTQKAKSDVKAWFIERGNKKGVPFAETIQFVRDHDDVCKANFEALTDKSIHDHYKSYYTHTFHGYETGNLSWEAAEDCLGATLSMSLSYWPQNKPTETAHWFRGNFTTGIVEYCDQVHPGLLSPSNTDLKVMDIAGSIGVSTKVLLDAFPQANKVTVVDLSPYFLSTAKMLLETEGSPIYHPESASKVAYLHGYAEDTPYVDESVDLVTISFLVHELPTPVIREVLEEAKRILKPGGVLAILDLDANTVLNLPPLRRFLFEVSEPHIDSYTQNTNMAELVQEAGFTNTVVEKNDPMNARWLGQKPF